MYFFVVEEVVKKIKVLQFQFTHNLDAILNGRRCDDILWCFTELLMFLDHLFYYQRSQCGHISRSKEVQLSDYERSQHTQRLPRWKDVQLNDNEVST